MTIPSSTDLFGPAFTPAVLSPYGPFEHMKYADYAALTVPVSSVVTTNQMTTPVVASSSPLSIPASESPESEVMVDDSRPAFRYSILPAIAPPPPVAAPESLPDKNTKKPTEGVRNPMKATPARITQRLHRESSPKRSPSPMRSSSPVKLSSTVKLASPTPAKPVWRPYSKP